MTSRLIKQLDRKSLDRPPVWLMRQAGRFHPEYRKIRQHYSDFIGFCSDSTGASDATMVPINAYPELDAAIIFSDILMIPHALGLSVEFIAGQGPHIRGNLSPEKWQYDPSKLSPVYKAIELTRQRLAQDKSLIGFCGAPWTLLAYTITGRNQHEFASARKSAIVNDSQYQQQLALMTESVKTHGLKQIEAGADVIMLFDSWSGLLNENEYLHSVIEPLKNITEYLSQYAPVIVFMRGSGQYMHHWHKVPCQAYGIDQTCSLTHTLKMLPDAVIQGNLDPAILLADHKEIAKAAHAILSHKAAKQLIFNLGHGVLQNTPPEAVEFLINYINAFNKIEASND